MDTHTLHSAKNSCDPQLVALISFLHLLEVKDRYWLLINPPNPEV